MLVQLFAVDQNSYRKILNESQSKSLFSIFLSTVRKERRICAQNCVVHSFLCFPAHQKTCMNHNHMSIAKLLEIMCFQTTLCEDKRKNVQVNFLKEGIRIVCILSSSMIVEVEESSLEHFFFQTFFLLLFNSFFLLLFQFN